MNMAVRIIKGSWWIDIRVNHKRHRIRSPENTKAGAEAYEALLRHKSARGESIGSVADDALQKQTFGEFAPNWYANYVVSNNKLSEQRAKRYTLVRDLIPYFGKLPLEQITTRHIEHFKAEQLNKGLSRKTVNNQLAVFS